MDSHNKYILIFLSMLFFTNNIKAQNEELDSLKVELQAHKEKDTIKINLLYEIAFLSFQRDLELTKLFMKKAENLSDSLNYIKGKAKVLYLKGILESRKSNFSTSLSFFKKSLQHSESIQDRNGIASIYGAFGITNFSQSQYQEALDNYKKASEIYKDLGNKREIITALINIGNVNSVIGNYDGAILNYKEALNLSEEINDENGIYFVNSSLGVLYKSQGNYPLAIKYYIKGLDYTKKNEDTLGMAINLNNLGDVYTSVKKFDKALEYHQQSLNYSIQKGNKSLIASNNINIGNTYIHKKEYTKALKYYNTSLEISQDINARKKTSLCFYNLGNINLLQNRDSTARENFIKAKDIGHEINYKNVIANSYLGIAETYLNEKRYTKALSFAMRGKEITDELTMLNSQKKASELLSEIYSNLGNYKKAFLSHQQYKILNDSLFNEENIEKITQLEYEYKYKQKLDSAKNRELILNNTVRTTTLDLEKSQSNYLLAIIGFLLVSILLASMFIYQKFKNIQAENQNVIMNQKLLRSQMTPHFIFNSLSVLQGMILNKEENKSVSYLSKFSKLLRIILENSREKTVLLSKELSAVENYLALQNLENKAYKYTISVEDLIDTSLFNIPPMLIQPFVENIIEHAFRSQQGDKMIDIHLSYPKNNLTCTITDNGIGIGYPIEKQKQHKKSLSTTITTERLKVLSKDYKMKGSVTIEDRKKYNQQGTIVTLVIPFK